jgi:hypothetical protein
VAEEMPPTPHLPRSFVDEIELELHAARSSVASDRERLAALEELHELATALGGELARTITVFDLVRSAPGDAERQRRILLVRQLRAHPAPGDPHFLH